MRENIDTFTMMRTEQSMKSAFLILLLLEFGKKEKKLKPKLEYGRKELLRVKQDISKKETVQLNY
ncbi:hypothetical protein JJC04_05215 [Flavobacterium covae]|nr:hypothetical protein [Flavobacterium covae]QYS92021.1 hypothetical protein JJC04_05215 [Flavobacterium covae]